MTFICSSVGWATSYFQRAPRRTCGRHLPARGSPPTGTPCLRMSAGDPAPNSLVEGLPGAQVLIQSLLVRVKASVAEAMDPKALLREYARKSEQEKGIIRVEVLHDAKLPDTREFRVILAFESASAVVAHEKTPHAATLRMLLASMAGDTGVSLAKAALAAQPWICIFPRKEEWIEAQQPTAALGDAFRNSLENLVTNVGLSDVLIIVATAAASSEAAATKLREESMAYCARNVHNVTSLRSRVFIDPQDPLRITIIEAFPKSSDDASFESLLGDELLGDGKWHVTSYTNTYPDAPGWTIPQEQTRQQNIPKVSEGPVSAPSSEIQVAMGVGSLESIGERVSKIGSRVFIICGWNQARIDPLVYELDRAMETHSHLEIVGSFSVTTHPPSVDEAFSAVTRVRKAQADCIIAYGGGSVLDCAKTVCALTAIAGQNGGMDDLASQRKQIALVAASRRPFHTMKTRTAPLPLFMLPNLSGTGAEVSSDAVLQHNGMTVCLAFEHPIPRKNVTTLYDARIYDQKRCDWKVATLRGLVSLGICLESFLSPGSSEVGDSYAQQGLALSRDCVLEAGAKADDVALRESFMQCSMFAGVSREVTGAGLTSSIAFAIGWDFGGAPECLSFSSLFAEIFIYAISETAELMSPEVLAKAHFAAEIVCQRQGATPINLVEWYRAALRKLDGQRLSDFEVDPARIARAKANASNFLVGGYCGASPKLVGKIVESAWIGL